MASAEQKMRKSRVTAKNLLLIKTEIQLERGDTLKDASSS